VENEGVSNEPCVDSEIMVGQSASMVALRRALRRLADAPTVGVVLRGESGSGKRTFARALHATTPDRGELIEAADPRAVESALRTEGPATVYLGELTAMPATLKSRIRRLLYAPRVGNRVRFVGAVSAYPGVGLRGGDFLPSFVHRFGITLDVPPLRERYDDLPVLAQHLLKRLAAEHGLPSCNLSGEALAAIQAQCWPGNVRELENALKSALLVADGGLIEAKHLPGRGSSARYDLPTEGLDLQGLEREFLLQALRRARGNRTLAASLLGLTRDQVRYRLSKIDLGDAS